MLVSGQASAIVRHKCYAVLTVQLEFMLSRELKAARLSAYEATVKSRGKDASFWQPYVEECGCAMLFR